MTTPLPPTDPLEQEFRALHPQSPSPRFMPQFQQNIQDLARRTLFTRLRMAAILTGVAAAASIATLLLMHRDPPASPPPPQPQFTQYAPPTLAEYRRAARESPQALDTLLRQPPTPPPQKSLRPTDLQTTQWN